MPHLSIIVREKTNEEPAFPEITAENFGSQLILDGMVILEGGMGSGQSSIGFHLIDPATGKHYMSQTSAELLRGAIAALNGAEQRFADRKSGRNGL